MCGGVNEEVGDKKAFNTTTTASSVIFTTRNKHTVKKSTGLEKKGNYRITICQ